MIDLPASPARRSGLKGRRAARTALAGLAVLLLLATGGPVRAQAPAPQPVSTAPDGSPADAPAVSPGLSADGRFVTFASAAGNLFPGDSNQLPDIFLFDRLSGELKLLTVSPAGVLADGPSGRPAISGSGRIVVFESGAANLVPGDGNRQTDVFAFDRLTGLIRRVSVARDGTEAAGRSHSPDVDDAGRYLVFVSEAPNLVPDDPGPEADVFIYDTLTGNVIRLGPGSDPAISGDGRIAAYVDPQGRLQVYHRVLGTWTDAGPGAAPDLSFSGRRLAYIAGGAAVDLDRDTGQTVTLAAGGSGALEVALASRGAAAVYRTPAGLFHRTSQGGLTALLWDGPAEPGIALAADGQVAAFSAAPAGGGPAQVYVQARGPEAESFHLAGRVTDALGTPLALVTIHDGRGGSTRSDAEGYFYLSGYPAGALTLTPEKEGYEFEPQAWNLSVFRDVAGYLFTASAEQKLLEEARKDIGMPYSFNRGCESPHEGCGKPFHGFAAGFCTDLILDAYTFGVAFDINYALQQDAYAHPDHFYRWRDARNTHDMWRYFHFSGQMLAHDQAYLPGDIVFFDWSGDGEIDHVALVSEVSAGRPVQMVDATGVIDQNPSGLATELEWLAFHENTVRGHARWKGAYEPVFSGYPAGTQVLQTALSGGGVFMRLVDAAGNAVSFGEQGIPGARYHDLEWEEVASVLSPAGRYSVEIRSVTGAPQPYIFTMQTLSGGLITGRAVFTGVAQPGEVARYEWAVESGPDGALALQTEGALRHARVSGKLRKP